MAEIELAEVLENLRDELFKTEQAGAGKEPTFEVEHVEIELSVSVTKAVDESGKVRFLVFELGADAMAASATIQRLKLTLTPHTARGGVLHVAGQGEPLER